MKRNFVYGILILITLFAGCSKPYTELDEVREIVIPDSEKQRLAEALKIPGGLKKAGTGYVYLKNLNKENIVETGQDYYDRYKNTDYEIIMLSVVDTELDDDEIMDSKIRKEKGNEKWLQVFIKQKMIFSNDFNINQAVEAD